MMMRQHTHTHNSKMHLICQAQITRSNFSFHYIQFLKHDSMKPAATYTMYETKFVMQIGIRMTTFGTTHTHTLTIIIIDCQRVKMKKKSVFP